MTLQVLLPLPPLPPAPLPQLQPLQDRLLLPLLQAEALPLPPPLQVISCCTCPYTDSTTSCTLSFVGTCVV